MVIDLARARSWRLLRSELARLTDRIAQYRRIVAPTSQASRLAQDLLTIAGELDHILERGLKADPATRRDILEVKIRLLVLLDGAPERGPNFGLASALLDHSSRALALYLEQLDAAA
jgi:hypothetical protein